MSRTGRCWREAHSGTAALAGCLNSQQSGHGAQQIQLWLLPISQVVSLRLSWRWGAESCQRHPRGKPRCKAPLSTLQRCALVPQSTELPCLYISFFQLSPKIASVVQGVFSAVCCGRETSNMDFGRGHARGKHVLHQAATCQTREAP